MDAKKNSSSGIVQRKAKQTQLRELAYKARLAWERAIKVRTLTQPNFVIQSAYKYGGWIGLFEEAEKKDHSSFPKEPLKISPTPPIQSPQVQLLCPIGHPDGENPVVFGVIFGTKEQPQVSYLTETMSYSEEIRVLSGGSNPLEMFRISTNCTEKNCVHYDGKKCSLATKVVEDLPKAVDALPICQIRNECRWWKEERIAACLRCPLVVTNGTSTFIPRKC